MSLRREIDCEIHLEVSHAAHRIVNQLIRRIAIRRIAQLVHCGEDLLRKRVKAALKQRAHRWFAAPAERAQVSKCEGRRRRAIAAQQRPEQPVGNGRGSALSLAWRA